MVKKPSQQALNRAAVTVEQAEALAQRLADKPYGAPEKPEPEKQCRTTISLGESMLVTIEDLALRNKRNGKDPKNVSAIVRVALEQYLKRHCCKVSDEAAFCLIQRPYISKTLLTRRISPRGSP
ncbi:ribbon-helix-helix domain-containing protein [Escherichia coli]